MSFTTAPPTAAWQHRSARAGFEVAYFRTTDAGVLIDGCSTAVEDGTAWAVDYQITLDRAWRTRHAKIAGRRPGGWTTVTLNSDGVGHWLVNGVPHAALDGCLDIDLEASALTNALPVHRLGLAQDATAQAPAAYVRAAGLAVSRLEQSYHRIADQDARQRFDYRCPDFGFACTLVYDESGLVLDYPGIAVRAH